MPLLPFQGRGHAALIKALRFYLELPALRLSGSEEHPRDLVLQLAQIFLRLDFRALAASGPLGILSQLSFPMPAHRFLDPLLQGGKPQHDHQGAHGHCYWPALGVGSCHGVTALLAPCVFLLDPPKWGGNPQHVHHGCYGRCYWPSHDVGYVAHSALRVCCVECGCAIGLTHAAQCVAIPHALGASARAYGSGSDR